MTASTETKSGKPRGRPQAARQAAQEKRAAEVQQWVATRPISKSLLAVLDDPDLFGGLFGAPSWEPWKAFLAALQALPMSEEHLGSLPQAHGP